MTQVLYQRAMLNSAFDYEKGKQPFDRFVIMTGQDYPLMSNKEIIKAYEEQPNKIYMTGMNLTRRGTKKIKEKFTVYHLFRDLPFRNPKIKQAFSFSARTLMRILPVRKCDHISYPNGGIWDVYQASGYMSLPHDVARLVHDNLNENQILMKYFKYSFVPEEYVIPTIIFNSKYKNQATEWKDSYKGLNRLSALEEFHYGDAIKVYTETDFGYLVSCGKMFARKLETGKSDKLMDLLDEYNSVGIL